MPHECMSHHAKKSATQQRAAARPTRVQILRERRGLCAHEFVTPIRHNVPQSHFKRSAAARTCASLGGTAEPRGSREFWKSTIQPGYSDESALA